MVMLSLSIQNLSAWSIISKLLPGASALRASSRVAMIIVLFAAPAIALAAKQWRLTSQQSWMPIAALFALLGSFAGIWAIGQPAFSLAKWKEETLAISSALQNSNCAVFWYEWINQSPWKAQVMAMHAQSQTRIPTANGYSGQFPKDNWSFTRSSGDAAYSWIKSDHPGQHHQLKALSNPNRWCIVNLDRDGNADIRKYDPHKAKNEKIITISKPGKVLFENKQISISAKYGQLYFNLTSGERPNEWVQITRNGGGISAQRGNYRISSASESKHGKKSILLIVDRNRAQGIEYEWIIDAKTGIFLDQSMRTLSQNKD
jgi:hypothetical protein